MNKICTSIEQSQKLIELGIDTNTADMCWLYANGEYFYEVKNGVLDDEDISAWSLTALLGLMSKSMISTPNPFSDNYCCRNVEFDMEFYADNPVDAAFEMVVWLKENGL